MLKRRNPVVLRRRGRPVHSILRAEATHSILRAESTQRPPFTVAPATGPRGVVAAFSGVTSRAGVLERSGEVHGKRPRSAGEMSLNCFSQEAARFSFCSSVNSRALWRTALGAPGVRGSFREGVPGGVSAASKEGKSGTSGKCASAPCSAPCPGAPGVARPVIRGGVEKAIVKGQGRERSRRGDTVLEP